MSDSAPQNPDWDKPIPPQTWHAPCEDVTTYKNEFRWFRVVKGSNDRIRSEVPPGGLPSHIGSAMRVQVMHGDIAWNPFAPDPKDPQKKGDIIPGGWRAEAVGWTEYEGDHVISYRWSTMFHPDYPEDPHVRDPEAPAHRRDQPIWQVITQWHQGQHDPGSFPPVAFVVRGKEIQLDLSKVNPDKPKESLEDGSWKVCDLVRGQWHHIRADIRWHRSEGTVSVWCNDQPVEFKVGDQMVTQLTDRSTIFALEGQPTKPESYMKIGLYREGFRTEPFGPFVLYHDEVHREVQQA